LACSYYFAENTPRLRCKNQKVDAFREILADLEAREASDLKTPSVAEVILKEI
jgi:hypothetical protein